MLGAILQALAVHTALDLRGTPIDPLSFMETLLSVIVPLEDAIEETQRNGDHSVSDVNDQQPSATKR